MTNKVHKLVKKEFIGYRYTTLDKVIFETCEETNLLAIDDLNGNRVLVQIDEHTVEMLFEFFRYLKEPSGD